MSIPFPLYAKIKNNYCLTYFGNCAEHFPTERGLDVVER